MSGTSTRNGFSGIAPVFRSESSTDRTASAAHESTLRAGSQEARFGEGANFEVRANFFNAFNLLNLQNFAFGGAGTIIEDANFGRSPGGTAGRVVELQARFSF